MRGDAYVNVKLQIAPGHFAGDQLLNGFYRHQLVAVKARTDDAVRVALLDLARQIPAWKRGCATKQRYQSVATYLKTQV